MEDQIVIASNKVTKDFVLPHEKTNSVKGMFLSMFQNPNKRYEKQRALQEISFEVKRGEFFGIVGRNGSGKSTMLKILAGIYQPTKGQIKINGKIVPFIELGVGFNGELTGRENVYLNGALLGFSDAEIKKKYDKIVGFAELDRFMDQKLKNYSSGMQVRLAFSVATILADSDILLIDEVLAVGDADFQRKCYEYFHHLKKNKKTVVFVSHDMNAVREYCDRAVLIEKSHVVAMGNPDEIASLYTRLMNEKITQVIDKEQSRWGSKDIYFDKVRLEKNDIRNRETIKLTTSAIAKVDIERVIFGISIKNESGSIIFGTNTKIKNLKISDIKKNEKVVVVWEIPNIFNSGRYYIDPAAVASDTTVYDWWEEAVSFAVIHQDDNPYLVNPEILVTIDKGTK